MWQGSSLARQLSNGSPAPSRCVARTSRVSFRAEGHEWSCGCSTCDSAEVFSGTARLTQTVREGKVPCLPPIDITLCAAIPCAFDVLDLRQWELFMLIYFGCIFFAHFGAPCNSYSGARKDDGGPPPLRSLEFPDSLFFLIRMCALCSWATCSMKGLAKPALPSSPLVGTSRSRILWEALYGRLHRWSSSYGMLVHGGWTWISVLLELLLANLLVWSFPINVCNARCIRPAQATTFTRCSKGRSTVNGSMSRRWSIAQSWLKNTHGTCVEPGKGHPGSLAITSFTSRDVVRIAVQRISQTTCWPRHSLETPSTEGNRLECSRCRLSAQARGS